MSLFGKQGGFLGGGDGNRRHGAPDRARAPRGGFDLRGRLLLVGGAQKAGEAELAANPRARSAVLRVAERLEAA